jgi:Zn-dependent protease
LTELTPERIALGITTYIVLLFSLSVHESAHAWTALRMGDDTGRSEGRISLNPLVHMDPIGTVLIPLIQIFGAGIPLLGWAKPVPVRPASFSNMRQGQIVVSGAGPASNLALALIFTAVLFVTVRLGLREQPLLTILITGIQMNVVLALFNLIPLPPLDGSHVASWALPRELGDQYDRIVQPYGHWILLILFMSGALSWVLSPVLGVILGFLYRLAI